MAEEATKFSVPRDASSSFWIVRKEIAKKLGFVAAGFIAELLDVYYFSYNSFQLVNDKWFYLTVEKVKRDIGISQTAQQTLIKQLIRLNLIEMRVSGTPKMRYFAINWKTYENLLISKE